jgi:hypothetical protein
MAGNRDDIIKRVKEYVLIGKDGKTPFTFFFNNIAPHTPIENINAVIAAVKTYGAPGATADTTLVLPETITFEEFLKNKMKNNTEGYTFNWLDKSEYAYLKK